MDRVTGIRVGLLAATGGFVDAVSFLVLFAVFTAHLSGDTTHLAVDLGAGITRGDARARIVTIAVFVAAVGLGTVAVTLAGHLPAVRRRLLLVEVGLLAVFLGLGTYWIDRGDITRGSLPVVVLAACSATAMGLQNVVARNLAGSSVATTFITGMLTAFAEDVVAAVRDRDDAARRRAVVHGGMWAAFLVGGVAGAAATTAWDLWALLVPIGVLLVVTGLEAGGDRTARTFR